MIKLQAMTQIIGCTLPYIKDLQAHYGQIFPVAQATFTIFLISLAKLPLGQYTDS
jgi:hypothetical protein